MCLRISNCQLTSVRFTFSPFDPRLTTPLPFRALLHLPLPIRVVIQCLKYPLVRDKDSFSVRWRRLQGYYWLYSGQSFNTLLSLTGSFCSGLTTTWKWLTCTVVTLCMSTAHSYAQNGAPLQHCLERNTAAVSAVCWCSACWAIDGVHRAANRKTTQAGKEKKEQSKTKQICINIYRRSGWSFNYRSCWVEVRSFCTGDIRR